eukprot:1941360-Lingulodinium_polyedra.AAC.1
MEGAAWRGVARRGVARTHGNSRLHATRTHTNRTRGVGSDQKRTLRTRVLERGTQIKRANAAH